MVTLRNTTQLAGAWEKWRQRVYRVLPGRLESRTSGRTGETTVTGQAGWELIVRHQMTFDFSEDGLAAISLKLDLLHDAASMGRLEMLTGLPPAELRAWLGEIIFIARETLHELDSTRGDAMWN